MTRFFLILMALVAVPALAPAAPVPRDAEPILYHHTKVGAVNTYRQSNGRVFTDTVVAVEQKGRGKVVAVARSGFEGATSSYAVSRYGIESAGATGLLAPGMFGVWMFKPPPGRWQWVADSPIAGRAVHICTAFGPERVTVPAGTFLAVRVHDVWAYEAEGRGPQEEMRWYAKGAGLIKQVYQDHNGTASFVLTKSTPGKD